MRQAAQHRGVAARRCRVPRLAGRGAVRRRHARRAGATPSDIREALECVVDGAARARDPIKGRPVYGNPSGRRSPWWCSPTSTCPHCKRRGPEAARGDRTVPRARQAGLQALPAVGGWHERARAAAIACRGRARAGQVLGDARYHLRQPGRLDDARPGALRRAARPRHGEVRGRLSRQEGRGGGRGRPGRRREARHPRHPGGVRQRCDDATSSCSAAPSPAGSTTRSSADGAGDGHAATVGRGLRAGDRVEPRARLRLPGAGAASARRPSSRPTQRHPGGRR